MAHPLRNQILNALWPPGLSSRMNVWAVLDAARDSGIYAAIDRSYLEKCCLYSGDLTWELQTVAPYLVQLHRDDRFTRYVIDEGWGNSWGIFLRTETGIQRLRRHLRGFLRVRGESTSWLLFRYYDPRVLRVYLPTCTGPEIETLFGPLADFVTESEDPGQALQFGRIGNRLRTGRAALREGGVLPVEESGPLRDPASETPSAFAPLVIRGAQFKAMREVARLDFERRLLNHLQGTLEMPAGRLRPELPGAIAAARDVGITRECDVARFCELMYRHVDGHSLERLPKEARNILLAYRVDATEKLRRLHQWMMRHQEVKAAHA